MSMTDPIADMLTRIRNAQLVEQAVVAMPPPKVEVTLAPGQITVKGPLGTLMQTYGSELSIERNGDTLVCKAANAEASPMHGTLRALVANMVKGVISGYEKKLTLVGVGFRA